MSDEWLQCSIGSFGLLFIFAFLVRFISEVYQRLTGCWYVITTRQDDPGLLKYGGGRNVFLYRARTPVEYDVSLIVFQLSKTLSYRTLLLISSLFDGKPKMFPQMLIPFKFFDNHIQNIGTDMEVRFCERD